MRLMQEWGFSIKLGQEEAYQAWLTEHEPAMAAAAPEGCTYLGTFAMVYSSEKTSGFYKTYFELDSYAAIDRFSAAVKDESNEFSRLVRDGSRFGDYDYAAPWSTGLYKAVVDATIFDPPSD